MGGWGKEENKEWEGGERRGIKIGMEEKKWNKGKGEKEKNKEREAERKGKWGRRRIRRGRVIEE